MWIYHTKQLDSSLKWNSWLNSNVTKVWLTFTFSWKSLFLSLENHENCSSFTIDHFLLANVLLSLSVFVIYVNCGQRASQNQFPGNLNPGAWIFMIKSERQRWREWWMEKFLRNAIIPGSCWTSRTGSVSRILWWKGSLSRKKLVFFVF